MTKKKNQKTHYTFAMSLYDIHQALRNGEPDEQAMADTLPPEYHEIFPLFRKVNADQLPPHRTYDHRIVLQEGFTPAFGPLYSL